MSRRRHGSTVTKFKAHDLRAKESWPYRSGGAFVPACIVFSCLNAVAQDRARLYCKVPMPAPRARVWVRRRWRVCLFKANTAEEEEEEEEKEEEGLFKANTVH